MIWRSARLPICVGALLLVLAACGPVPSSPGNQSTADVEQAANQQNRTVISEIEARHAAEAKLLPAGTRTLLKQGAMNHGDYAWDEEGVGQGELAVWVDVQRQTVSVFRGGHEIGTAVILYGAPGHDTPLGTYPILRKVADYHSRTYDAPMPFSLFLTDDGVALHGSKVKPRRATHGCIGLPEEFAEKLFNLLEQGDEVTIVQSGELEKA